MRSCRRTALPLFAFSLALWLTACGASDEEPALCAAVAQHHVAQVFGSQPLSCDGVRNAAMPRDVQVALRGSAPAALRDVLAAHKASAVRVARGKANGSTLAARLARAERVAGLRALALDGRSAMYAAQREPELSGGEREGLAYVARALLRGAREPSLNSFPPSLRRVERVEIMVLLRERGAARLWRSARGTSIARALLTATRVARERWREREQAMGGPLGERLLDLDVEVSLLAEDGVLVRPTQPLVDGLISPEHGIGFEYKSGWHYLLPEDVGRRGRGSAYRALVALMAEQGVPASAIAAGALRVYRFVTITLGSSTAPLSDRPPG